MNVWLLWDEALPSPYLLGVYASRKIANGALRDMIKHMRKRYKMYGILYYRITKEEVEE
jgi:hypothetical protein